MVKRTTIALLVCSLFIFPVSFVCLAVGDSEPLMAAPPTAQTTTLNYPIYDASTLNTANPTLLAPNGLTFRGFNVTLNVKNGMLGMPSSTFTTGVGNGNVTVLDETNPVTPLPDVFVTPPIYSSTNITEALAPLGVAIHKSASSYQFIVRPNGVWTCNPSSFTTYSRSPNFEVLQEPDTEPDTEPVTERPEEPTTKAEDEPPDDGTENNTFIVRSSILMGFALYTIVSLIGFAIWKSVHLFNT